jgi:hypothetical protein
LGEPGQGGHRRPQSQADGHEAAAVPTVGQSSKGYAEQSVEDRERGAVEEADLGVVEIEVGLDAFRQDRDDLAVDEVEDVDDDEQEQSVPGVGGNARARGVRFFIHVSALPHEHNNLGEPGTETQFRA